jgi:hypothetical protein
MLLLKKKFAQVLVFLKAGILLVGEDGESCTRASNQRCCYPTNAGKATRLLNELKKKKEEEKDASLSMV